RRGRRTAAVSTMHWSCFPVTNPSASCSTRCRAVRCWGSPAAAITTTDRSTSRMGARGTRLALALAGALLPGVTPAVDIDLRMSAASIYTDNIALTPDNEEGEFVLRADPGIR